MITAVSLLLFTLNSLWRLDILAWIVGIPLIALAVMLLFIQRKQQQQLDKELSVLSKLKRHSIEYELVLKAMKLSTWRVDVTNQEVTFESDYREHSDNLIPPPGTKVEDIIRHLATEYQDNVRKGMNDLMAGLIDDFHTQYQVRIPHSDRTYWSESYITIDKRDLQGKPLTIVGTTMRIDQQKEIEHALMEAVYHAEESDRLKSAFLANISHEIRTPLNAIVGFSDVLPMVETEEERQELINLIKQNNTHLLRLFDDIVSMSKLEARSGSVLKKSNFELKPVFQELKDKYAARAAETGITIKLEDIDSQPSLCTDRDRLREILNQYVNNAIKFTKEGSITLGSTTFDKRIRIWVKDTGKGIPEEKCNERLFERFVKVDEFIPGTGLGLSICRSLALTLNGEVGVESVFGEGSTFWVELDLE